MMQTIRNGQSALLRFPGRFLFLTAIWGGAIGSMQLLIYYFWEPDVSLGYKALLVMLPVLLCGMMGWLMRIPLRLEGYRKTVTVFMFLGLF